MRIHVPFRTLVAVLVAAAVAGTAGPAMALSYSHSGKTLAVYTESPANITTGVFSATILKGKKKNALIIEVTGQVFGGAHELCIESVTVNGRLADPSTGVFNLVCTGSTTESMTQTVSGVFVLDIDDAELASPGSFYGVPLDVVVDTATDASPGLNGSISVVVRMEKK